MAGLLSSSNSTTTKYFFFDQFHLFLFENEPWTIRRLHFDSGLKSLQRCLNFLKASLFKMACDIILKHGGIHAHYCLNSTVTWISRQRYVCRVFAVCASPSCSVLLVPLSNGRADIHKLYIYIYYATTSQYSVMRH